MQDILIYVPKTDFIGYYESIKIREIIKYIQLHSSQRISQSDLHRSIGLFFSYMEWLEHNFDKAQLRPNLQDKDKDEFREKIHEIYRSLVPFRISMDSGIFLKHDSKPIAISICTDLLSKMIDRVF